MSPEQLFFDPSAIDVSGSVTLVIARRTGVNMKGYRIAMHRDVADELRKISEHTLTEMESRTPVEYVDDLAYNAETHYPVAPTDMLIAHRPESRRGRRKADDDSTPPQVQVDPSASTILAKASSLPLLPMSELRDDMGNPKGRS